MGEKPSVTKSDFENVVDVVLNHGKTRDGDLCPFPDQERRIERYIRHIVGVAYTEIEKRVGKTLLERMLGGLQRFRFSDVKPGLVEDDNGLWVMHDNVVGRIKAALAQPTPEPREPSDKADRQPGRVMDRELTHHCAYEIAMEIRRLGLTIDHERAVVAAFRKAADTELPPGPPSAPIPPRDKPVS